MAAGDGTRSGKLELMASSLTTPTVKEYPHTHKTVDEVNGRKMVLLHKQHLDKDVIHPAPKDVLESFINRARLMVQI